MKHEADGNADQALGRFLRVSIPAYDIEQPVSHGFRCLLQRSLYGVNATGKPAKRYGQQTLGSYVVGGAR